MGSRTTSVAVLSLALISLAAPSTSVKADLGGHASSARVSAVQPVLTGSPAGDTRSKVADRMQPALAGARVSGTKAADDAQRAMSLSKRVPAGCDRLVSSLVKSTASAMLGRCLT